MTHIVKKKYPLDNSGIVHLAVLPDGKPNLFRIRLTLRENVDPALLQKALDTVAQVSKPALADILEADRLAREAVNREI